MPFFYFGKGIGSSSKRAPDFYCPLPEKAVVLVVCVEFFCGKQLNFLYRSHPGGRFRS